MHSTISTLVSPTRHRVVEHLSRMDSVSNLVKCGFVQLCCAISFLLLKILGNNMTYNYKETLHQIWFHFQSRATTLVHGDVAAIVLYTVTGVLLLCLTSRTNNMCLIISVIVSTLLSLFAASGLTVFSLVAILTGQPPILLLPAIVLLNSLVMLLATMASTMEIWRISFCNSNAAMDNMTNLQVGVECNRSLPSAPRSTFQVANERNTTSSQPSTGENLFQYFTTDCSEAEQNGDAPPPYHIATGRFPCKHCRFTAKNKNDFVEHFRRKPDHWSCLACKRQFTTFKDFSRHMVRRRCNQPDGPNE